VFSRLRDVHDDPGEELERVEGLDLAFLQPRAFMPTLPPVLHLPFSIPAHPIETGRRAHLVASEAFHRRLVLGLDVRGELSTV